MFSGLPVEGGGEGLSPDLKLDRLYALVASMSRTRAQRLRSNSRLCPSTLRNSVLNFCNSICCCLATSGRGLIQTVRESIKRVGFGNRRRELDCIIVVRRSPCRCNIANEIRPLKGKAFHIRMRIDFIRITHGALLFCSLLRLYNRPDS